MPTIREYLKAQNRRMKVKIWIGLGAVVAVGMFIPQATQHAALWAFCGALAVAAFAILTSRTRRFKCPNCGNVVTSVRRSEAMRVTAAMNGPEGLGACPHCGTSFDVPMPD
jgi:predicted RNA-binding Zn-ribbon protein involved in translation (DUF1610 family)